MSGTKTVFSLRPSFQEFRPTIDFENPRNASIDWDLAETVLQGLRPSSEYLPFEVEVEASDAHEWDYYAIPGTMGLLSSHAVELLNQPLEQHFALLEAKLNGYQYYLLKRETPLDCFDREHSIYDSFRTNPHKIKDVKTFRFHLQIIDDPLMFWIREFPSLVCATQSVAEVISKHGRYGFLLEQLDHQEWRS